MVYKNPKKQRDDVNTALGTKGSSIMQPMAAHRGTSIVLKRNGGNDVNVNTEAFWQKKVENIPVDQVFFHKYFTQKKAMNPTKGRKADESDEDEDDFTGSKKDRKKRGDSDDEDGSELDEDDVWNAMMTDMPNEVRGGLDEDEEDLSDADLEELMLSDLEDEGEEGAEGEAGSDEEEDREGEDDEEDIDDEDDENDMDDGDDEEAAMFMDEADDMVPSDEEAKADSDEEERGNVLQLRKKCSCREVLVSMDKV